jgi:hypothetical protein
VTNPGTAEEAAGEALRLLLTSIEAGGIAASDTEIAFIRGARAALDAVSHNQSGETRSGSDAEKRPRAQSAVSKHRLIRPVALLRSTPTNETVRT